MIGNTILHYKMLEKLGEGGMGVVYKAHDTKLKRDVAIKFLPRQIAASEDERERFKIEAQAAAALNHPNIATIHNIEEVDDEMFIVMEYIEGQELKQIVGANGRSPLAVEQILDYATQIASGLQAAHEKGVIHRDIKSSNIMITATSQVKVMDFGLAKLSGGTQLTQAGTTLGTVPYMSPEQAQGLETDQRTDIWAFGVVLYEMLTGEMPFKGDYEPAVIYSIMHEDPEPVTTLRPDAPENLISIVNRALARDLNARYQNIGDLLNDLKSDTGFPPKQTSPQIRHGRKTKLVVGGISIALLLLLRLAYFFVKPKLAELKIVSARPLTSAPEFEGQPSWSPDGTRIAYSSDESGKLDIWIRQVNAGQGVNLTKDHPGNSIQPAWSPDGEWIVFHSNRADAGLFAIPSLGGNVRQILALKPPEFGTISVSWSPDASKLVFSTNVIYIVSAQGGEASQVPFRGKGLLLQYPAWSPDGERIAITEMMGHGSPARLWIMRPDGSEAHPLTAKGFDTNPVWSPDNKRILFVSDRGSSDIWWMPVNKNGKAGGQAKALTTGIGVGAIALSADGTKLAYEKTVESSSVWSMPIADDALLRLKDAQLITSENSLIEAVEISPDGNWLSFDSNRSGNSDIWIMRPNGSDLRQITTDPADDSSPTWSPDSKRIAFHSLRSGNRDIWVKPIIGGAPRQLTTDPGQDWIPVWSPNSEEIAFCSYRNGYPNVWIVSASEQPRQVTYQTAKALLPETWSPDGQKFVFASSQSKEGELYILSPKSEPKERLVPTQLRRIFGFALSPDGSSIYAYVGKEFDSRRNIYTISVEDGAGKKLTNFENEPTKRLVSATSDGERFYLVFREQKSDIWLAELEERE